MVYFFGTHKRGKVKKGNFLPLIERGSIANSLLCQMSYRQHALLAALDEARETIKTKHELEVFDRALRSSGLLHHSKKVSAAGSRQAAAQMANESSEHISFKSVNSRHQQSMDYPGEFGASEKQGKFAIISPEATASSPSFRLSCDCDTGSAAAILPSQVDLDERAVEDLHHVYHIQ